MRPEAKPAHPQTTSTHHPRRLPRLAWGLLGALLWVSVPAAQARLIEEVIKVPVKVSNGYGKAVEQDAVVTLFYDDTAPQPYPVAVINHGRAAKPEQRTAMGRAKYSVNSRWLTQLGFLVVVPTRVGYGETGGEDVEDTGTCSQKNYPPGYEAAAVQTLQVLQAVRQRPGVAPDRAVLMGQSFGGTTAVTLAAKNLPGVQATLNFAGGGGGNPETQPKEPCAPHRLKAMFADYGQTARTPMLWVYTENDQWMGAKYPREWFDAYQDKGGTGEFVLYPPNGKDGHGLFSQEPEIWHARVLAFLQAHGYPDLKLPPKKVRPLPPVSP